MSEKSWKDRVVGWHEEGLSYAEIVERCHLMGKTKVSKSTIHTILHKRTDNQKAYTPSSIVDQSKIKPIFEYIFEAYVHDSQQHLPDLVKEIKATFDETVSVAVIKRIRTELALNQGGVRYGHSVRAPNRLPRMTFCTTHLGLGEMFMKHCFTDESMVQSGGRGRFVYILKGDNSRRVKPRHKHPASVCSLALPFPFSENVDNSSKANKKFLWNAQN